MQDQIIGDKKEVQLDHRHLAFFFVGAAAVCAVFFALGFLVGRGQAYEASLKAQTTPVESSLDRLPPRDTVVVKHPPEQSIGSSSANSTPIEGTRSAVVGNKKEDPLDYHKELDFYNAVKEQKVKENFHPVAASGGKKELSEGKGGTVPTPAKGSISVQERPTSEKLVSLQVAALRQSQDAENLAKTLRSKGYAVFLVRPGPESTDKLIRVQVGPFREVAEASATKARLEKDGYKSISKK